MSEVTLKPCPFCQGEATLTEWPDLEALVGYKQPDPPSYWVVCPECEAGHPPYHDRNEAIAAWNTRPAQDERLAAMQAEVERMRGMLREAEVKLTDVQGAYATRQYSANLLFRIRVALGETFEDLSQEFEAVWDANRDKLYEGDTK